MQQSCWKSCWKMKWVGVTFRFHDLLFSHPCAVLEFLLIFCWGFEWTLPFVWESLQHCCAWLRVTTEMCSDGIVGAQWKSEYWTMLFEMFCFKIKLYNWFCLQCSQQRSWWGRQSKFPWNSKVRHFLACLWIVESLFHHLWRSIIT